jgi:phosphatidylserine/phosphatidylglycerophosphate/cardiolipin synthase-like enzyme
LWLAAAENLPAPGPPATIGGVLRCAAFNNLTAPQPSQTVRLIADAEHYEQVIGRALNGARVSVWIASANLKEVMMEAPRGSSARAQNRYMSVTQRFSELVRDGVQLRVLHASGPSAPLARALARRRRLVPPGFERRLCPRVHLKLVAVDGRFLYLGSANFTGAGLGAKGDGRRNFELGIVTDDYRMLDAAQERFERIWSGGDCGGCRLRRHCPKPLDELG